MDMAAAIGIELFDEEQYFALQKLGESTTKTSNWIATPADIRKLGARFIVIALWPHLGGA